MNYTNGNAAPEKEGRNENVTVKFTQSKKNKLKTEAQKLGISVSDLCEGRVSNFEAVRLEGIKAKEEVALAKAKVAKLEMELANSASNVSRLQKELDEMKRKVGSMETEAAGNSKVKIELENLKKQNAELMDKQAIFSNEKLLWFYEQLKGKPITVKSPNGESVSVTHNDPKDVLFTMINSFQIQ